MKGIRNSFTTLAALGIAACASAPMPVEKLAVAQASIQRAEQAQAAQFAQVELQTARSKYSAAQAAVDKNDADVAARLADQADVDAQLAESTARAKQQQQLVTEMEESLRDLRNEALRGGSGDSGVPPSQVLPNPQPGPGTQPVSPPTSPN